MTTKRKYRKPLMPPMASLLFLTLFMIGGQSMAQKPWEFGVDASLDMNFLGNRKSLDATVNSKLGFALRGHAQRLLLPHLGLDFALGYSNVSYDMILRRITFNGEVGPYPPRMTANIHSHQLQVPILLKYYLNSREKGMYFSAGPMLGLSIAYRSSGEERHATGFTNNYLFSGTMNNLQLGLQGCVGHRFPVAEQFALAIEAYGNASLGKLGWVPLRPYTAGLRLSGWF